jgi:hypothetical protein
LLTSGTQGRMRLAVPGPRDLLGVLERGGGQLETLLGVVPRIVALLDDAEAQLRRIGPILDRVEAVTVAAAAEVVRVSAVADVAEVQVERVRLLMDRFEPSLTRLQPTLETLADTTSPDEVTALVRLVDQLPELTERLETDVLPVLGTLGSVAPDLRHLLAASRELNEIIGKVPGFGRLKRRVEEENDEEDLASG